jgi:hypothetical protein
MKDKILCSGWHNTFGWLRRPDLDEGATFSYETPDGTIVVSHDCAHKKRMHLSAFEDAKTKEKYVSVSQFPYIKIRAQKTTEG